jgi:hypothetical protein
LTSIAPDLQIEEITVPAAAWPMLSRTVHVDAFVGEPWGEVAVGKMWLS